MPIDYYFGYYFFAPNGRFEPCGMFTIPHIVSALICIFIVVFVLIKTNCKIKGAKSLKLLKTSALVLTVLEAIKISHSFIYGDHYLDAWFPLSYCGLFIIALWLAGFGSAKMKAIGKAFISLGCPFAGIAFLIFPTTSLMSYPIWHYFSLYSMFYHSLMIFVGITIFREDKHLSFEKYLNYAVFVLPFSALAIAINTFATSNLMNLREPYNIPIDFLQNLYADFPPGYIALVLVIYMLIPLITLSIAKIQQCFDK